MATKKYHFDDDGPDCVGHDKADKIYKSSKVPLPLVNSTFVAIINTNEAVTNSLYEKVAKSKKPIELSNEEREFLTILLRNLLNYARVNKDR